MTLYSAILMVLFIHFTPVSVSFWKDPTAFLFDYMSHRTKTMNANCHINQERPINYHIQFVPTLLVSPVTVTCVVVTVKFHVIWISIWVTQCIYLYPKPFIVPLVHIWKQLYLWMIIIIHSQSKCCEISGSHSGEYEDSSGMLHHVVCWWRQQAPLKCQ
jgi:hypothetical protein